MTEINITVTGNITADPELRFGKSGDAFTKFTVAQNSRKFDKATNQWVDGTTTYVQVKAFRNLAEYAAQKLQRGSAVLVMGVLSQEDWEKDGQKRSTMVLTAKEIGISVRERKSSTASPAAAIEEPAW